MSHTILVKQKMRTAKQSLLSFNMYTVDALFPGFTPGDFAVVRGSPVVNSMMSLLCVRAQMPTELGGLNSNVIFLDGGNTFKLYQVSKFVQSNYLNPVQVLNNIYLSRAFTAYQMTKLIMKHLNDAVEKFNAKLVIISDIASLFLHKNIPTEEAKRVYSQIISYLQSFARQKQLIIIATYFEHKNNCRNTYLRTQIFEKANVVMSFRQTMYDREFELEKHPSIMLGTAEFLLENFSLSDFMQG